MHSRFFFFAADHAGHQKLLAENFGRRNPTIPALPSRLGAADWRSTGIPPLIVTKDDWGELERTPAARLVPVVNPQARVVLISERVRQTAIAGRFPPDSAAVPHRLDSCARTQWLCSPLGHRTIRWAEQHSWLTHRTGHRDQHSRAGRPQNHCSYASKSLHASCTRRGPARVLSRKRGRSWRSPTAPRRCTP